MKKKFLLLLICCCFLFVGCNYGGVGLVQNADGTVIEYYNVPFPEEKLISAGVGIETIRNRMLPQIKAECDQMFKTYINAYQQRIQNSQEYTIEEKTGLIAGVTCTSNLPTASSLVIGFYTGIRYEIKFASAQCYLEFKNANEVIKEEKTIETINNFFTTTTKVIKDPIFDKVANESITLGQTCVNIVNDTMQESLGKALWEDMKQYLDYDKYSSKFLYTYIVPSSRIHSNADEIQKSNQGYYYHTWEVGLNNLDVNGDSIIKIEYWTISANKVVWYITSIIIAGVIITMAIFIGRHKEKKEQERFKKIV